MADDHDEITRVAFAEEERALIRRLADIARGDPSLAASLLRTLLAAAAKAGGKTGGRAQAALERLRLTDGALELRWARNVHRKVSIIRHIYEDLLWGGCRTSAPLQWTWEGEAVEIGIEVHLISPPSTHRRSLRNCVEVLREAGKPTRGVLLLSAEPPRRRHLPRASAPEWLGALTWSEIEPRLRQIAPFAEEAAEQWSRTLDETLALRELRMVYAHAGVV